MPGSDPGKGFGWICGHSYNVQDQYREVGLLPDILEALSERSPLHRDPKLDSVIRCMHEILFGAQVAFCCLHRGVAEQQLNLLKLAASRSAQLRACAPEIVRRDARYA